MLETTEAIVQCPYCGESIEILVDPSDPSEEYIEDCQVCCRPITMRVTQFDGEVLVQTFEENEY